LINPGRFGLGIRPGIAGVIVAESSFLSGFSLYVENGHLKHTYSFLGLQLDTIGSRDALPEGKVNVRYEFTADKPGVLATGGTSRLFINGKQEAEGRLEHTVPLRFALYSGMDIGTDNGLPVVPKLEYAMLLPKTFRGASKRSSSTSGRQSGCRRSAENLSQAVCQRTGQLMTKCGNGSATPVHRSRRFRCSARFTFDPDQSLSHICIWICLRP
jgi:hypothetical protein